MTARLMAMALMLCTGSATSAELGRLFFTPAQRATLDNARKQNIRIEISPEKVVPPPPPSPQSVSVNGVVRSSDGKSTVWLNNRAVTGRQTDGLTISTNKNDNRVRLNVPQSGRSIDLKVGQTVEIISGTIQEGYARRPSLQPEVQAPPAESALPASPVKLEEAVPKQGSTR